MPERHSSPIPSVSERTSKRIGRDPLCDGAPRLVGAGLAAALLVGCASGPVPVNSLAAVHQQVRFERVMDCRDAWSDYEARCNRRLTYWYGGGRDQFCSAWSRSRAPLSMLPGMTEETARCR